MTVQCTLFLKVYVLLQLSIEIILLWFLPVDSGPEWTLLFALGGDSKLVCFVVVRAWMMKVNSYSPDVVVWQNYTLRVYVCVCVYMHVW